MIDDDLLLQYFYDEVLTDSERLEIEHALRDDAALAARYDELCNDLGALGTESEVAAPDHLKHQWHASIEQAARLEHQKTVGWRPGSRLFAWGGALTAALVIAFAVGTRVGDDVIVDGPAQLTKTTPDSMPTPVAFTRGLQVHLQNARWDLDKVSEQSSDEQAALLLQIVAQNRIFERTAETKNAHDVARLMRALEPILLKLAEQDISPEDAAALRSQLSFELKAMLTKIERSASEVTQSI